MIDKDLRGLERFQDPLKLKLLQRRLGQSVYIQEALRPIQVFNDTELLIDISENKYQRSGYGTSYGVGIGYGEGSGSGYISGYGSGIVGEDGYGIGDGHENGKGWGYGQGSGYRYREYKIEYENGRGAGEGSGKGVLLGGAGPNYEYKLIRRGRT